MVHRSIRATAAVAATLAIALGSAVGTTLAEPPTVTGAVVDTVSQRAVPLQGVINARDIGGYRTIDGRVVRTGLVYRTAALNKATDADLAVLTARRVHVIDDLRTSYERLLQPDRIPAGARENWDDILGGAPMAMLASATGLTNTYRAMITAPGANQGFANVLHDIIGTRDGTVLYHCSAGKDRTGWTSAVLLTILGVDRKTVDYDYLLSNHYRNARPDDGANGVSQAELNAAFDQVRQTYGSFDNYVYHGLRLTDGDIAALKAKMLS
jgi:protein-tyrosine phosphatase